MTCNVIASGSKGNAVVVRGDILIDCGVPYGALKEVQNDLHLVLLTHIHGDHFHPGTIAKLAYMRPALRWACPVWLEKHLVSIGVRPESIDVCDGEEWLLYNSAAVRCETIPHDVPNCAWHIYSSEMRSDLEKVFYATDCASLDAVHAPAYDLYMVEANYETEELEQRQARKIAAGEFSYEARAAAAHLSREQAEEWIEREAAPGKSQVIYLHKHTEGGQQ